MGEQVKNTWKNKPIIILLVIIFVILILLLLASLVIQSGIFGNVAELTGREPTTAAEEAVDPDTGAPQAGGAAAQTSTATPTRVVQAGAPTATPEPGSDAAAPTHTPTQQAEAAATLGAAPASTPVAEQLELEVANILRNGTFEWGVGEDGVALQWQPFSNGGAKAIFAAESWPLAIRNGDFAQRITIYEAHQPNRFAGIYQQLKVIPGADYDLKLYGQIRSKAGDIATSQYGYRMQYAIDWQGGSDWQAIAADEWIELPWDEQLIDNPAVEFAEYTTTLVPPSGQMTFFIRAWNKWSDPVEAQYTLDTLSLVGPAVDQAMVDQSLPLSGAEADGFNWMTDWLLWISILFLIFLVGTTLWRNKHRRTLG